MKTIITWAVIIILIIAGIYFISKDPETLNQPIDNVNNVPAETATTTGAVDENDGETVIGTSIEGKDIVAYHFGTGDKEVLFVGGIHGGYSWNTVLVAYELVDYLTETPAAVPAGLKVTVVPVLNPDGLNKIVGTTGRFEASSAPTAASVTTPGRFNARNVDLNRNFDCDWQAKGMWQSTSVSGGANAFSEPESQAMRNYVEANDIDAAVVWYSSAGGVFASNCHDGVTTETREIMNAYAKASGYPANDSYDFYEVTGDMSNWLAKIDVPAISVLLTNHTDVEWNKNKAGIDAMLKLLAE